MTNEQIETARERAVAAAGWLASPNRVAQFPEVKAEILASLLGEIDALCAAARQDSLVGKRVSVRAFSTTLVGTVTKESRVWTVKHKGSQAGPVSAGELVLFEGDDFELLEDDNGN